MSGRRCENRLHRFQRADGVAMSRGGELCIYVALDGVSNVLVWLQTSGWAHKVSYTAATSSAHTQQRGKTTPDASDESERGAQRAYAEEAGGT